MNEQERLNLMYRIGYCDAQLDMNLERIQSLAKELERSLGKSYAEVVREQTEKTGKEKRFWEKAFRSLHLWNIG